MHFHQIKSKNTTDTIGHHFNISDHHDIDDVQIHIVDFIHMSPHSKGSDMYKEDCGKELATPTPHNSPFRSQYTGVTPQNVVIYTCHDKIFFSIN